MATKEKTTVTKSYQDLKDIEEVFSELAETNKDFEKTKLAYAGVRFSKINLKPINDDMGIDLTMVRIDNALTDKATGAILYQDKKTGVGRDFQYSIAGLKKTIAAERKIRAEWAKKEFEIKPFICTDLSGVEPLTDRQKEILKGVIIE